jgi:hypothetical protein
MCACNYTNVKIDIMTTDIIKVDTAQFTFRSWQYVDWCKCGLVQWKFLSCVAAPENSQIRVTVYLKEMVPILSPQLKSQNVKWDWDGTLCEMASEDSDWSVSLPLPIRMEFERRLKLSTLYGKSCIIPSVARRLFYKLPPEKQCTVQ